MKLIYSNTGVKKIAITMTVLVSSLLLFSYAILIVPTQVYAHPKQLTFPLIGVGTFVNDFNSPRGNEKHNSTDIMAPKMTKIVAAVGGTVTYMPIDQPTWGYMITIKDDDGFTYEYVHMNNDRIGTDDGSGGPYLAYAPDLARNARVEKGQFLGYVGDSGNAENTGSHLHFEITSPSGEKINPYAYLLEATKISAPVDYPAKSNEVLPYGPSIRAPVSIATASFDNGVTTKIISGTGIGYSPHVQYMNTDGTQKTGFYAYDPSFIGGVDVASGDVDGDGIDEIITGTKTGAPHVQVFDTEGKIKASFYAFDPNFTGGVNVGSYDIDGDGKYEVLVGAGAGGSPRVRVLKLDGSEVLSFYAYAESFAGGVDVASGDVTGNSDDEILTVPGPGGSAHLRTFGKNGVALSNGFNAYEAYTGYTGGARISVGNIIKSTAKDEVIVGPNLNGGPHFRLFKYDGVILSEGYYLESWWTGSYDVAAGNSGSYIATGDNRRSTIRKGPM
jgi:hypothetical protein